MELTSHSLSYDKAMSSLSPPPIFPAKSTVLSRSSVKFLGYNCLPRKLNFSVTQLGKFGAIKASDSENSTVPDGSVRWLLEPIGNGDTRHIGYKIAMPGAYEIVSAITVGRVRDKADIVIPVPTGYILKLLGFLIKYFVSALHVRIQKAEENLLITDLDSTNGTFIDEKRLQPGIVYSALPGNLITFGDTNLAIFRVYKLENEEEFTTEPEESVTG